MNDSTAPILGYAAGAPRARIPWQTWMGVACVVASPFVSIGLSVCNFSESYAGRYERSVPGAIGFATGFFLFNLLPIAAMVYGISGTIRSIIRRRLAGIVISALVIVLSGVAWLVSEVVNVHL